MQQRRVDIGEVLPDAEPFELEWTATEAIAGMVGLEVEIRTQGYGNLRIAQLLYGTPAVPPGQFLTAPAILTFGQDDAQPFKRTIVGYLYHPEIEIGDTLLVRGQVELAEGLPLPGGTHLLFRAVEADARALLPPRWGSAGSNAELTVKIRRDGVQLVAAFGYTEPAGRFIKGDWPHGQVPAIGPDGGIYYSIELDAELRWLARFPAGGEVLLSTRTIGDALAEIDRRWPPPEWANHLVPKG